MPGAGKRQEVLGIVQLVQTGKEKKWQEKTL